MFNQLTDKQAKILNYNEGCVVAKACPGSGKTYSVAARIARLLGDNKFTNQGIAAMSFTNVAAEEIEEKLKNDFNVSHLGYPHFIGTIDKFVNHFIFLPYGHLIMECERRPELVGEPHASWTKGKGDRTYGFVPGRGRTCRTANPHSYFDCTSFNINGELYAIVPPQQIHFSLKSEKYYKQDGTPKKQVQEVIDAKWDNFKLGFANQSDANYLAMLVLEKFPVITSTLANKFKYFIIDEAQDTDPIQIKIIEMLNEAGAGNIMLIGDRDQAIFEWHKATPELFDAKYSKWDKIDLDENWRSSANICKFNRRLCSFNQVIATNPTVRNYSFAPIVVGYSIDDFSTTNPIIQRFCMECEQGGIKMSKETAAVTYRGRRMIRYLGLPTEEEEFERIPWRPHHYHVKDIIRGKFLLENGYYKMGYKLIEKGWYEALHKDSNDFVTRSEFLHNEIEKQGLNKHRAEVFKFVNALPDISNSNLNTWINQANASIAAAGIGIILLVKNTLANVSIRELFAGDIIKSDRFPFYYGTIHSVKGKTFEAVLMFVGDRAASAHLYTTLINEILAGNPASEEMRIAYVGLTRPRKILMVAVPEQHKTTWEKLLGA